MNDGGSLYTPISIKVAPVNHVHSLQCIMVNPSVAGSLVLFTFIEIMETICEKAFKRAFKANGAKILKHKRAEKFLF